MYGNEQMNANADAAMMADLYDGDEEPLYPDEEAPEVDDGVKCCPDCERPNQFGELCWNCQRERDTDDAMYVGRHFYGNDDI